jgi:DNA-binding SARP family transcriptional activator
LLRQDVLAEDVLQRYLRAAYLSGQRETALKTFERFAQELWTELDLEPMQATLELVQSLRTLKPLKNVVEKPQAKIPLELYSRRAWLGERPSRRGCGLLRSSWSVASLG